MKIHTNDGKVIDTNQLTDKEAEIYEALSKFHAVCSKYDVTMMTRIVLSPQKYAAAQSVSHKVPEKDRKIMFLFLIDAIGKFVEESTQGQVRLFRKSE
jgi:hypothetical protein